MRYEDGIRRLGWRVYLLRNGVVYKNLDIQDAPAVNMDTRAEIKKSLSATVVLPDDVDILNDRLRPVLVIDGVEYPLGEFIIATAVEDTSETGSVSSSVEAYDGCYLARRYRAESRPHFAAGTVYTDKIQELLQDCGITKAIIENCTFTMATDREDWEIGTTYLEIINQLLSEINYASLWFDADGFARIQRAMAVSAANIKHTYRKGRYSVISPKRSAELDVFNKYNVFMAIVDNADLDAPMIAKAVNDNPASILSVQQRGRIQAPVEQLNNIASQDALQEYVNNVRDRSMMTTRTVKIETALMPGHEVGDVVALDDGIYRETGWEITLGVDGQMTHTLEQEVFM